LVHSRGDQTILRFKPVYELATVPELEAAPQDFKPMDGSQKHKKKYSCGELVHSSLKHSDRIGPSSLYHKLLSAG
jgi:hypothetical protein